MSRAPQHAALLFCVALSFMTIACGTQRQHGDARLIDAKGVSFMPEPADYLRFPKTPLRTSGVFRYHVTSLPQVIYPSGFLLEVPEDEALDRGGAPVWSSCVVRASLLTPDGRPFHVRTIHLGRNRSGSGPGRRGRREVFFPFTDYTVSGRTRLPHHLSYILQIEVLQPSLRASDMLDVEAFTVVQQRAATPTA